MNNQNPAETAPWSVGQMFTLRYWFLLLLAFVFTALWLAVAWDSRKSERDAQTQVQQQTAALAMAFANHTEDILKQSDHILLQLRADWLASPKTFASAIARHQNLMAETVIQIGVIATDGSVAFSNFTVSSAVVNLSDREHFKVHRDGGQADRLFISRPVKGRVSGKWSIQLTRAIFDAGRFAGVLVLSLDPDYFVRFYQRFDLGANGVISIVRDSGEVMARSSGQEQFIGKVIKPAPGMDTAAPLQGSFLRKASSTDGIERLFSYYRLPEYGLSVRIGVGVDDMLAPVRAHQHFVWVSAATLTLVLAWMGWLLLRYVSRLQAVERAQSTDRQRLADIVWGTGVGTWEWHVPSGETRFNARWAELIGYTLDELAPISIATWMKFAHPDDLVASGAALEKHFTGETNAYEFESRMLHKNGHWIWVLDRGRVTSWSADGKPLWMAGTHFDITVRKKAELAARDSDLLMQQAQHMAAIGNWELDLGSSQLTWSDEIFRIFEIDKSQFGANYDAFLSAIHPQDREAVNAAYLHSLQTRTPYNIEHRLLFADGRVKYVRECCESFFSETGQPLRSCGTVQDISANKLAEIAMQENTLELERSNSELEQFSYSISHDLRQPLRMISSYMQLLQKGLGDKLNGEHREYFNFAINGAQRLDAMLRGLLEYSRVGRKGEPQDWLESRAVLDEALLFLRPLIAEAQAQVHIEGAWPRVLASPNELLHLLQNLLHNALKFRVAGQIPQVTLTSTLSSTGAVGAFGSIWQVCITDNGVGINPDQISRLFKVFARLQSRSDFEGTGIGLALCRKITEHHKGRIWAESQGAGQGSRFCFRLPMHPGWGE